MDTILTPHQEVKRASGMLIFLGIILLLLGFLSIGSPYYTGLTVDFLVGCLLVAGGIVRIALAFRSGSWGSGLLAGLVGLLTLACGVLMLVRPMVGLIALTLLLAAYFLAEGIFQTILAFNWKPLKGWGWTLFSGLTAIALGVLIWMQWPVSGMWAVGILVGIDLIFAGFSLMGLGIAGRSVATAAAPA